MSRRDVKKNLDPYQRKLLLRIIDDKDLIIEKTTHESIYRGFRAAAKIMAESLYLPDYE